MAELFHAHLMFPRGGLLITATAKDLVEIRFTARDQRGTPVAPTPVPPLMTATLRELAEYFQHRRERFTIPISPGGTPFQQLVWLAARRIPFGQTATYKELATKLGRPGAARAVGQALHRNPLPIIIPCHRVIGAAGQLTGFAGGLELKRFLLAHENNDVAQ